VKSVSDLLDTEKVAQKPNNKQVGCVLLANYLAYACERCRQVWQVGAGQGKSRITIGLVMVSLLRKVKAVKLVFADQKLRHRDKFIYSEVLKIVDQENVVEYKDAFDPEEEEHKSEQDQEDECGSEEESPHKN